QLELKNGGICSESISCKSHKSHKHESTCTCEFHSKSASKKLANNRKIGVTPAVTGFKDSIKSDLAGRPDKYLTNLDAVMSAGSLNPLVVLDSYVLSNIVAQIEANTDFFPKGTTAVVAGNCGKKVMPLKLRKKIFGLDFDGDDSDQCAVDLVEYNGSYSYKGVLCCHNVWGCPVCGRKVSERRKKGLVHLITAHFERFKSDSVIASLFTVPHGLGDDVEDIKDRLLKAYHTMTRFTKYKKLFRKYSGCGSSRNTEVTWGMSAGFHPHIHVLNFFEESLLVALPELADQLFALWTAALEKNGFTAPSREAFGCKIIPSDKKGIDAVAAYFAKPESDVNDADIDVYLRKHKASVRSVADKSGWGVEHEMTKWHLKKGQGEGLNFRYSMIDLLRGYKIAEIMGDEESRKMFRALWLSYRAAFKSERQLWTRHKYFKIKELECSDKELAEDSPDQPVSKVVYSIPFQIWLIVVYMGARGTILENARQKGLKGITDSLAFVCDNYHKRFPDDPIGSAARERQIRAKEVYAAVESQRTEKYRAKKFDAIR
ncbi:MAG: hypothetical protein PHN45_06160, partial [Methylococcales bacterium]|nr:hypothetical protein [Methylococcales bacterium]